MAFQGVSKNKTQVSMYIPLGCFYCQDFFELSRWREEFNIPLPIFLSTWDERRTNDDPLMDHISFVLLGTKHLLWKIDTRAATLESRCWHGAALRENVNDQITRFLVTPTSSTKKLDNLSKKLGILFQNLPCLAWFPARPSLCLCKHPKFSRLRPNTESLSPAVASVCCFSGELTPRPSQEQDRKTECYVSNKWSWFD